MRLANGAEPSRQAATPKPDLQDVLLHYGCHAAHSGKYLCLVHDEDNPSMNVDLRDGLWMCHSCGAGGDSWTLIQMKEALDFKSAVKFAGQQDWSTAEPAPEPADELFGRRRPGRERKARGRAWTRPW